MPFFLGGMVHLLPLPLVGLNIIAVAVSTYMGCLRFLIADNGAVEVLAMADDSSFAVAKSPNSMLSECSLLEVPSSLPLPTSDVDGAEDLAVMIGKIRIINNILG
jgi:hypothetical protein